MNRRQAKKRLKLINPVLYGVNLHLIKTRKVLKGKEFKPCLIANYETMEKLGIKIPPATSISGVSLDFTPFHYKAIDGQRVFVLVSKHFRDNEIRIEAIPTTPNVYPYKYYPYKRML